MREKTVIVKIQNAVVSITLNRHTSFNSFNDELTNDLLRALVEVKNDNGMRVVV